MAIKIYGNGTIGGLSTGGLPDGCVDNDTLANSSVTVNGTAISLGGSQTIIAGKVLQIVQAFDDAYAQTGSSGGSSWYDIISANITPSYTSSKILITGHVTMGGSGNAYATNMRIVVDSSYDVGTAAAGSLTGRLLSHSMSVTGSNTHDSVTMPVTYLHSPSTTSQVSYKFQGGARDRRSWAKNGPYDNNDGVTWNRAQATTCIQLWEIAG